MRPECHAQPSCSAIARLAAPLAILAATVVTGCGGTVLLDEPGAGGTGPSTSSSSTTVAGQTSGSTDTSASSTSTSDTSGSATSSGTGAQVIQCGETQCDAISEECCISGGMGGGMTTCAAKGQCEGFALPCSGSASCPDGMVCCGTIQGMSPDVQCQAMCGGGGNMSFQLCQTDGECPPGTPCQAAPFAGLKLCGGFGG